MPEQSPALAARGRHTRAQVVGLCRTIVVTVIVLVASVPAYAQSPSPQEALKEVNSLG